MYIWYPPGESTFSYVICVIDRKVPLQFGGLSSIRGLNSILESYMLVLGGGGARLNSTCRG